MDTSLQKALELTCGLAPTASNLSRCAKSLGDELARWGFLQWELRKRGASKFALAAEMLFDRDGFEMASDERVAAYHASKFKEGEPVVEIGCGVGADTIALANRGPVLAYDLNPTRVEYALHNLAVHRVKAEVRCDDGLNALLEQPAPTFVFSDPARRTATKRRLTLPDLLPDPFELVCRFGEAKLLGIKMSPMTPDRELNELVDGRLAQIEFVSFGRECREALVWIGSSIKDSGRFAVHVETGARVPESPLLDTVPMPEEYLYEADPAAIRADALGAFDMAGLGESNGYLTSSLQVDSPWLRGYRVLYSGRGDAKDTKAALRTLEGGTPVVKQRGADIDPAALARQLRGDGKRSLIVLAWKVGSSVRHSIVEPMNSSC